jgi:hypothetical protein
MTEETRLAPPRRLILATALLGSALAAGSAQASASGGDRKKGGGQNFVQIQTLTASLVKPGGRRGVLTVESGVDAPGPLHARIVALQPRLRDGYSGFLQRFALALRPGFAPDADHLARELQAITDRIVGKKGARLLLGTILVT